MSASRYLSKQLFRLSGWQPYNFPNDSFYETTTNHGIGRYPAYSLDFLLEKLPSYLKGNLIIEADGQNKDKWCAYYDSPPVKLKAYYENTPADAACQLAITLFKQGELKREA